MTEEFSDQELEEMDEYYDNFVRSREKEFGKRLICPTCTSDMNHVQDVTVFNGNNEYERTAKTVLTASGDSKIKSQAFSIPKSKPERKTKYRMRSELGIEVKIYCEMCEKNWKKTLYHHKGSVYENSQA